MFNFLKHRLNSGFTMLELMAVFAIIAILSTTIFVFVGNYIQTAKEKRSQHNMLVLNEAISDYKTMGGDLTALTISIDFDNLVSLLTEGVSLVGGTQNFGLLNNGQIFSGKNVKMAGSGKEFYLYAYEDYEGAYPDDPRTPTTDFPNGKPMGYFSNNGASTYLPKTVSNSGWVCYVDNEGAYSYYPSNSTATLPAKNSYNVWSCAGDGDPTMSGDITSIEMMNSNLVDVDFAALSNLTRLIIPRNAFSGTVDISENTTLNYFDCNRNSGITSLDVSNNTALTYLNCNWCDIGSLDVTNNTALTYLNPSGNNLTALDVSNNTELTQLDCSSNSLTSIDITNNTKLQKFYCGKNNISTLNVSANTQLNTLSVLRTLITSIDLTNNTALTNFDCNWSSMENITFGANTSLSYLDVDYSSLTSLDVSGLTGLNLIKYYNTPFIESATTLNAFYSSLESPGGGTGTLVEVSGGGSSNGVGDTGLIPAGWNF